MVREIGAHVNELCRVSYSGIRLGELPKGSWRELKKREVAELRRRVQPKPKDDAKTRGKGRHKPSSAK